MAQQFKGVISMDVRDSIPDWAPYQPPQANQGAPNVLYVVWDDTGMASWDTFGGAIEMPHHGSARDEAYAFIDWIDPGVIMQSTGGGRLDDARWDAQRRGRDWYTTAHGGAIVFEIGAGGAVTHRYWFDGW